MPEIGEVRRAVELGRRGDKLMWVACPICKEERWARAPGGKLRGSGRCRSCSMRETGRLSGSARANWHGGRHLNNRGYMLVYLTDADPFWPMARERTRGATMGYALEHRLVMARHLGRLLARDEVVHHKNGVKDDNRIENLELSTNAAHITDHHKGYQDGYEKGYRDAEAVIAQTLEPVIAMLNDQLNDCWRRLARLEADRVLREATEH